jgi:hypothetical protein
MDLSDFINEPKGFKELSQYLDAGFIVGNMTYAKHDENTRFVIVEKYPEKDKNNWSDEGGYLSKTLYIDVELIRPTSLINLDITINKDGTIESGI